MSLKLKLLKRLRAAFIEVFLVARRFRNADKVAAHLRRVRCKDRAQWRRWHRANQKYQRRLTAFRRLTGRRIDPRVSSLPRWAVR